MMISVLTLHLIPVPSGNRRAFNLRGRAGNVEFLAALFLRLRIVPSFRAILSWHGWIERQQWKISENLWKIRQTTNLDCNHGNKPAVTFNCTIFPRFLFSISQSCFSNCLIAMSLSLFGFVVDDDADKREMESPWTKVEARRMKNLNRSKRIDDVCVWIGRRKDKRKSYPRIGKYLYAICYLGLLRVYRSMKKMKSPQLPFPFEKLITALFQKEKLFYAMSVNSQQDEPEIGYPNLY